MIEASHFDANEAYAAVDRHRLEDYEPYIYRTKDAGKTLAEDHRPACRPASTCRRSRRIRRGAGCSSPAPSWACSSRSTTATPGSRCSSICRRRRCATSRFKDNDLIVAHARPRILDARRHQRAAPDASDVAPATTRTCSGRRRVHPAAGTDDGTPTQKDEAELENPPTGAMSITT